VSHVGLSLLALALSFFSSLSRDIQNAFLNNDPNGLRTLLEPGSYLQVSLPPPLGFSDLVSDEQAHLLFVRTFAEAKTTGFYPEGGIFRTLSRGRLIFRARWEFLTADGTPGAFRIFCQVKARPPSRAGKGFWKITGIRADPIRTGAP